MTFSRRKLAWLLFALVSGAALAARAGETAATQPAAERWVTAWTTAPFAETPGKETPPLTQATVRQVVRITAAGRAIRIRLGNYFGAEPLVLDAARVAIDGAAKEHAATAWHPLRFGGQDTATVAPSVALVSDPLDVAVTAGTQLTIDLHVREIPHTLTSHSAARATSYLFAGDFAERAPEPKPTQTFTRWYFLCGVDVQSEHGTAIAVLGDSIADGYGCPPDSYARWPDVLARRLQANPTTANIAVLNVGIGGNRLLRDGLGPRALSRIDRDVFDQHGVRTLVVCLGINDIGTRIEARKKNQPYASATDIIGALRQIADRGHEHGLTVIGATLTPYAGAGFYWSEDGEADREAVNEWIRHSDSFDRVIDFDATLRDPSAPNRLAKAFDSGDHLHPSVAGYARMAESIDLGLFTASSGHAPHAVAAP